MKEQFLWCQQVVDVPHRDPSVFVLLFLYEVYKIYQLNISRFVVKFLVVTVFLHNLYVQMFCLHFEYIVYGWRILHFSQKCVLGEVTSKTADQVCTVLQLQRLCFFCFLLT